jgi:hypothetical protein
MLNKEVSEKIIGRKKEQKLLRELIEIIYSFTVITGLK